MYDKILLGKNELQHIVAIEPEDNFATIFTEYNGEVKQQIVPNNYWILAQQQPSGEWIRLKGDLHFKYGKKYATYDEFYKDKITLKKRGISNYSIYDKEEALMVNNGYTYFKGLTNKDVSSLSFDIETTGLDHNETSKVLLISNIFRDGKGNIEKKLFAYDDYKNEVEFINAWSLYVREKNPSILLGYNIVIFDLPYLNYCMDRNGLTLNLGRNNTELTFDTFERKLRVDGNREISYLKPRIYGRQIIDMYFMSLKYDIARNYQSYQLKSIIKHEALESKTRQFYDGSKIRFNYKDKKEWEKIKAYCIDDAEDVLKLYDLMSTTYFLLAQYCPKSYQTIIESASGSQLNAIMIRAYLQDGHSIPQATQVGEYEGAISKGNPGVYRHCFKLDVKSMYPSIIISEKLFNKEKDPQGYLLHITKKLTEERLVNRAKFEETKERKYEDQSNLQKTLINSIYGMLGAHLLFNWPEGAAKITRKGREIITKAQEWAESLGFQLVNVDTDSIMISNNTAITLDQQKSLIEDLNKEFTKEIIFTNDGYFETVICLKAKNYILWDGKKLKIKGSALRSPSLEPALREFINKVIDIIIEPDL